jgi:hypothetical protein
MDFFFHLYLLEDSFLNLIKKVFYQKILNFFLLASHLQKQIEDQQGGLLPSCHWSARACTFPGIGPDPSGVKHILFLNIFSPSKYFLTSD